jgi:hypothetical protein
MQDSVKGISYVTIMIANSIIEPQQAESRLQPKPKTAAQKIIPGVSITVHRSPIDKEKTP